MLLIFRCYVVWNFLVPHNHGSDDRSYLTIGSVADPDLQIGERERSSRPRDKRGGGVPVSKFFFRPFGPQFGLRTKGAPGPPGSLPWIRHWGLLNTSEKTLRVWTQMRKKPFRASCVDHICAFSFFCHCKLSITTIYLFQTNQSIQTTLPSQKCYKNDIYYLDNLKTPYQLKLEDVKTTGHILLK